MTNIITVTDNRNIAVYIPVLTVPVEHDIMIDTFDNTGYIDYHRTFVTSTRALTFERAIAYVQGRIDLMEVTERQGPFVVTIEYTAHDVAITVDVTEGNRRTWYDFSINFAKPV